MAMALLDGGIPGAKFHIDAIDISARVVAHAVSGVYRKGSFRSAELTFRDRYFTATAAGHSITDAVRRQVEFQQGNLFSPSFLPGMHIYDVIFCRNVLIYFDQDTQRRALEVLSRLLTTTGLLFVGPSETSVLGDGFVSTQSPRAFAFRRAASEPKRAPRTRPSIRVQPMKPRPPVALAPQVIASKTSTQDQQVGSAAALQEGLDLANRGCFDEAAERCHAYLKVHGPSAEVYHLLGLVRDASGNIAEAMACYRKALYLDPHHEDTLAHLALLMETHGKSSEARALRARAERLARRGA
jgi:chemotaxis protein methyltransferase WspC